jgi:hypothetical protein
MAATCALTSTRYVLSVLEPAACSARMTALPRESLSERQPLSMSRAQVRTAVSTAWTDA